MGMKKLFFALLGLVFLASCASNPPPPVRQETDTSPKIYLDVLTVVVLDRSLPYAGNSPYATNNFQPTIANAIRRWITDKFVAVGTTGEAIVVIKDASLKSESIPHPDSWFTREQAGKYMAHAEIEFNVSRRDERGQATAEAAQFVTLPETPSAVERQNAYNQVLNAVMRDLGANLRGAIRDHLGGFSAKQP